MKRKSKKRKTSTIPSRVYKYFLLPPIECAMEVEQAFVGARAHYNGLIGIDLDCRAKYRELRRRLFPEVIGPEDEKRALEHLLEDHRKALKKIKSASRSRDVDPAIAADIEQIKSSLKAVQARLKPLYATAKDMPEMKDAGVRFREEAKAAIRTLRPTTYWGTYLLCEAAARDACGYSCDPSFNDEPSYLLANRIGVHMCGGMGVDELAGSTLMRINPIPTFRPREKSGTLHARGKAARTMLWFRIGSIEGKKPLFAKFPMVMDRPLPADARIKDAYITRRPCSARIPWQYSLCIVLESRTFEQSLPGARQEGTTSINFGWRQMPTGEMRVAMINSKTRGLQEILLPQRILTGFAKCRELQGILDEKFDAARDTLAQWIAERQDLPGAFLDSFEGLPQWRSHHRLAELVWYWTSHRISGDEIIFPAMSEWKDRYRHLYDWISHQRHKLLDWRDDFFGRCAKRLATMSAKLVIDTFHIANIARRPDPEEREEGGQTARRNRQIAAPGELRLAILHAAAKYHCEVEAATTTNKTRRCNLCGFTHDHSIEPLVHQCENPMGEVHAWDQDVNNTENLQAAHASGEVVPLMSPAETTVSGEIVPSKRKSFRGARKELHNLLTTQ